MDQPKRSAINNSIRYKSMTKAIREKDRSYALEVAMFYSGTYSILSTPEIQDTRGRILYKLGKKEEAATAIRKAIVMKEERKFSTKELHLILDKMNNGLPLD